MLDFKIRLVAGGRMIRLRVCLDGTESSVIRMSVLVVGKSFEIDHWCVALLPFYRSFCRVWQ